MGETSTRGIEAPSVVRRAITCGVLLVGFYAVIAGVSLALFAAPVLYVWVAPFGLNLRAALFLFTISWVPAFLLSGSLFSLRLSSLPDGLTMLTRGSAPALLELVNEIAREASIEPPDHVYLAPDVNLAVTEHSGHRCLIIGAPMLATATVDELRAGLAHEFGHFALGDKRLSGVVSFTHDAFRSVLVSTGGASNGTRRIAEGDGVLGSAFGLARRLGEAIIKTYATLFFRLTRPSDRRAELAADQLAARLAGRDALVALLGKTAVVAPLYDLYLETEARRAILAGALPTDLIEGFATFSRRMRERGAVAPIEEAASRAVTAPYDSHPSDAERIAALRDAPASTRAPDTRIASSLVELELSPFAIERDPTVRRHVSAFLSSSSGRRLSRVPWSEVPGFEAELARENAATMLAGAASAFPDATTSASLFSSLVTRVAAEGGVAVARALSLSLDGVAPNQRPYLASALGIPVLANLFAAALLEKGAEPVPSLGEGALWYKLDDQRVAPFALVARAFGDRSAADEITRWAASLHAPSRGAEERV